MSLLLRRNAEVLRDAAPNNLAQCHWDGVTYHSTEDSEVDRLALWYEGILLREALQDCAFP